MKKLPRKIIREEQERIDALQTVAQKTDLLEQVRFLPQTVGFTIVYREDGTPVVKTISEEPNIQPGEALEAAAARAAPLRIRLAEWDELQIRPTADVLQIQREEAVTASLQEIEANGLEPFLLRLQRLGPKLLADPHLILVVHDWWLGAKWGNKESAQRVEQVLNALTAGSGRWRTGDDISQDDIRLTYEEEYTFCQKAKKLVLRQFRNRVVRLKNLREKFQLSTAEIEEVERKSLTPSAWAVKRTATRLNLKPERVRRILLEKT